MPSFESRNFSPYVHYTGYSHFHGNLWISHELSKCPMDWFDSRGWLQKYNFNISAAFCVWEKDKVLGNMHIHKLCSSMPWTHYKSNITQLSTWTKNCSFWSRDVISCNTARNGPYTFLGAWIDVHCDLVTRCRTRKSRVLLGVLIYISCITLEVRLSSCEIVICILSKQLVMQLLNLMTSSAKLDVSSIGHTISDIALYTGFFLLEEPLLSAICTTTKPNSVYLKPI